MKYDSEHKARTRGKVLKEAAEAMRAHGTQGIGVADIMARAGLTHGGFYAHFKSKDDLIAQAITYMFDERYSYFLSNLDEGDPSAALSGFIDRYLSSRHRNAVDKGCPVPVLSAEVTRLAEDARAAFEAGLARLTQGIAALLEQRGAPDPLALACSVLAEMVGALALSRTLRDEAQAEALLENSRNALKQRLQLADVNIRPQHGS